MATKITAPPESVGRLLNFTTGRMNALCGQWLDPHGLSLPQWVVLSCLWRERPLSISTLSDIVGTGVPAMSRILDRMEARGLIVRRNHATDGRVTVVDVTDTGRALDHLSDFHERINAALFAGFSELERATAFELLGRMKVNAEQALK